MDTCWEWMKKHPLFSSFICFLLSNFAGCLYEYALNHNWILTQAIVGASLPFINFPQALFFIEFKTTKERLKLSAVASIAMAIGGTLMSLLVYRQH